MGTTPAGIPYPDPDDHLADYPATAKDAAETIPHTQAGALTLTVSNSTTGTVSLTFPRAFARNPRVCFNIGSSTSYLGYISAAPTKTGVVLGARHYQGVSSTANLTVYWIAVDPAGSV